jgi:hypothetical protein
MNSAPWKSASLLLWLCAVALAQSATVVVRPAEIDDVLVNPGMGIQTFQRFNGDALNEGQKWSEVGPEGKTHTSGPKPSFPESSVAYFRWFWSQLEPEEGKYRWEIIDNAIAGAREHNQKLMFRVMPYDEGHPLPEWYRNSGAKRANTDADPEWKSWVPDSADPLYIKHWGRLVHDLGARYDNHPYVDSVDISTIGYWGEGWGPYAPDWPAQTALLDLYFEAFPHTPVLVNFVEARQLAYAAGRGSGWRFDCWGDMGNYWRDRGAYLSWMLDVYPQLVATAGSDAWRRAPVSLETCWVPATWRDKGWDVGPILEQALRWHVSTVNVKSTALPPEWKKDFDEFQKKMGYRFVLRRLEYPKSVKAGQMMAVSSWWVNRGVAPPYHPYSLAFAIGDAILRTNADIRKWLPGDAIWDGSLYVPDTVKPGTHRIRLALLDPTTGKPAINLAVPDRQSDGWYDLGEIQIQ